jgi:hypothetical protein
MLQQQWLRPAAGAKVDSGRPHFSNAQPSRVEHASKHAANTAAKTQVRKRSCEGAGTCLPLHLSLCPTNE